MFIFSHDHEIIEFSHDHEIIELSSQPRFWLERDALHGKALIDVSDRKVGSRMAAAMRLAECRHHHANATRRLFHAVRWCSLLGLMAFMVSLVPLILTALTLIMACVTVHRSLAAPP